MTHDRLAALLTPYADHELGPFRRFLVGRHLARCPSCMAELEAVQAMRVALATHLSFHRAPPGLAARIGSALPRDAPPIRPQRKPRAPGAWSGAAALAGGLAGVTLTLAVMRSPASDALGTDVVASHVRSMMADHLTDVATSDQHTVKPWLASRLELSPVVKDLAPAGFPLVGGRLDYVDGHRAAALVYRRDRHVINLFVFVADRAPEMRSDPEVRDGFNIVRWRQGGLTYVAVSDVELTQLLALKRLVEE